MGPGGRQSATSGGRRAAISFRRPAWKTCSSSWAPRKSAQTRSRSARTRLLPEHRPLDPQAVVQLHRDQVRGAAVSALALQGLFDRVQHVGVLEGGP